MRRFYALLVTTFAVGAAVLLGAAPGASADPISSCSTTTGTVVAVDFSHWGGPIARGCGVGQPTGYALLHAAGFSTAGDSHDGPAFICRIGNAAFAGGTQYPTPSAEPCVLTPPASAYWSYWLAPAGQNTWTYSSLGAMSEAPKPGEVELWSFGGTTLDGASGSGLPRVSPAQVRATNSTGGSGGSGGGGSGSSSGSGSSAGSGSSSGSGTPGNPSGSRSGSTSGSGGGSAGTGTTTGRGGSTAASSGGHPLSHPPTAHRSSPSAKAHASHSGRATLGASAGSASPDSSGSPAVVDAAPAAQSSSTGSALPLVIAVLVVVLLAGGAGWAVRRRRQQ